MVQCDTKTTGKGFGTLGKREIDRYVPVLLLLLVMMVVSMVTFHWQYHQNEHFGKLINLSGKQRMLSQRLAFEAFDYYDEPTPFKAERYNGWLALIQSDHNIILSMDLTPKERAYYEEPSGLNHALERYVGLHGDFLSHPTTEGLQRIKSDLEHILGVLDGATALHQRSYEARLVTLRNIKILEGVMFLLVLAGSWFFVFKPSARKLEASYAELVALNDSLGERVDQGVRHIREQEQLIIQQSKLASLGEMLGNISHQWRQPLNALGLTIQDLEGAYKHGEVDEAFIKNFTKESMQLIKYMSATIDDFRSFARPSSEKKEFDVTGIMAGVLNIVSAQLKANNILLKSNHEVSGAVHINGYANELKQVVINLINNARDAILERKKEGGQIEITISTDEAAGEALITVSDDGGGIPKEIMEKIFEPYFTTKLDHQGTGLGLYMSKVIVEKNMSGRLYAENVGAGACFSIRIPLAERPS